MNRYSFRVDEDYTMWPQKDPEGQFALADDAENAITKAEQRAMEWKNAYDDAMVALAIAKDDLRQYQPGDAVMNQIYAYTETIREAAQVMQQINRPDIVEDWLNLPIVKSLTVVNKVR